MKLLWTILALVLMGGMAVAQRIQVLGEEPYDLSPLVRGKDIPLGVVNKWFEPLNVTVRLEDTKNLSGKAYQLDK